MDMGKIVQVLLAAWLAGPAQADQLPPVETEAVTMGSEQGFQDWVRDFRARALAVGISDTTFAAAFSDTHFDEGIVKKDRNQTEFSKQIWDYLDTAVSEDRVVLGKKALADNKPLLDEIEARYGVAREIVVAIWGLESAYGSYRGSTPVVAALATLAYDGRRGRFFEAQLLAALRILEAGQVRLDDLKGSWAGAMGHTQFMPTSWEAHAVDFRGDGRRDIWGEDPTDALASAAAYLAANGWTTGLPWGMEVTLPTGFDYSQSGERVKKPVSAWTEIGVRDARGAVIPDLGLASVLLPAGHRGAAFLIFSNFQVIETYNTADAYVIAVGHLADRLRGGAPIRSDWPREDRALTGAEKREMQGLLARKGFDPGAVDGIMGPNTIQAVRLYQAAEGLVPDGYGSLAILERLRR
jgi:membrane-bound lytic murein transglycosylase B